MGQVLVCCPGPGWLDVFMTCEQAPDDQLPGEYSLADEGLARWVEEAR